MLVSPHSPQDGSRALSGDEAALQVLQTNPLMWSAHQCVDLRIVDHTDMMLLTNCFTVLM